MAPTSPARFAHLEHLPVALYAWERVDQDFVLRFVNRAARVANPPIVDLLDRPMAAMYRDQPELVATAGRALAEQVPLTQDHVVRRHDRTEATTPLRLSWIPLSASDLLLVVQPIAVEAGAAAALRESEARYRGLFQSLPDGVLLRGAGGQVLACNEVAARLVGLADPSQLLGRDHILGPGVEVRGADGRRLAEADLPSVQCVTTGTPYGPETYELVTATGSRWIRASAAPIVSSTGAVSASVTVLADVTEHVRIERELRAAAMRLELALDAGRMGIWEYDAATTAGWWSDNLYQIFALNRGRPHDMASFMQLVHPDDRAQFAARAARSAGAADNVFDLELRLMGDDGVARWARIRGQVVADPPRVVGTIVDVTEQHRMEDELRRAHRLESIGRLAGGVAHDFNNLLAAMMGSLEAIEAECPPHLRADAQTIQHALVRARELTRQLLAFARKQPIEFRDVDLAALVTDVERMLHRLVGPSIELVVAAHGPVPVRADPASLEQVLVNLVVNARDAMPAGGRLAVSVARGGEPGAPRAVLEVRDSGTGMDDDTRRQIFDPFFTTKTGGTGLGLASCYGIVEQHHGAITVDSTPGAGTVFRVALPLTEAAAPAHARTPRPTPARVRGGCVLVVDDEDLVRNTAVRVLRGLGYDVLAAASAAQAVELAAAHPGAIDVLLCDIAMPVRDGPSLAAELLAARPELHVIFVSGYADSTAHVAMERTSFLPKPYTRRELVARLDEIGR